MSIFGRVSDILTANIHEMLDRAEDPEAMVKQVIREMDEALQAARRNMARAIAGQRKLEKELQANKRLRDEWQQKAEQAIDLDRDDLARKALARKREHEDLVATLEEQSKAAEQTTGNLRRTLRALDAKLADAKRRRTMLVARKKAAEAQIAAEGHLAKGRDTAKAASFAKFERFEEGVEDLEAEATALAEISEEAAVDAEFADLADDEADIEIELEELKRKKGKAKGGGKKK